MARYLPNPTAVLSSGSGPVANAVVQRIGWRANDGWTFSAVVNGALDLYQARNTPYTIAFTDGLGNSRTTPPMIWTAREFIDPYSVSGPNVTSLSGFDLTSSKMRQNNQNFTSFLASSSSAIINQLALRAGVTVTGVTGALSFWVIEEDVKGAKLSDALERFMAVSASEWGVNEAGEIVCRAWEDSDVSLSFDWGTRQHRLDPRSLFTGLRVGKRSSLNYSGEQVYDLGSVGFVNQGLSPFLTAPTAVNESIAGAGNIAAVTFYNAANQWVTHHDFTLGSRPVPGGVQGSGQCTYFIAEVTPQTVGTQVRARVRVNGTPPDSLPSGVDAEFLYPAIVMGRFGWESGSVPVHDISLGEWPAEGDFIDQLFVSQGYAIGRLPYLKSKMNAPADSVSLDGPLQCNSTVKLFARHTYEGREYKAHSIDWDYTSNTTAIALVRQTSEV